MDCVESIARLISYGCAFDGFEQNVHAIVADRVHRDRPGAMGGRNVEQAVVVYIRAIVVMKLAQEGPAEWGLSRHAGGPGSDGVAEILQPVAGRHREDSGCSLPAGLYRQRPSLG